MKTYLFIQCQHFTAILTHGTIAKYFPHQFNYLPKQPGNDPGSTLSSSLEQWNKAVTAHLIYNFPHSSLLLYSAFVSVYFEFNFLYLVIFLLLTFQKCRLWHEFTLLFLSWILFWLQTAQRSTELISVYFEQVYCLGLHHGFITFLFC